MSADATNRTTGVTRGETPSTRNSWPQTTDRGPWDGALSGVTSYTYCWGTHEFTAEVRLFDDGEGHVRVRAPSDPPPSAEEIVRDGIDSGGVDAAVATTLAQGWGVDPEEVTTDAA